MLNKIIRRAFSLSLTAAIALQLAACGSKAEPTATNAPTASITTPPSPAGEVAPSAEPQITEESAPAFAPPFNSFVCVTIDDNYIVAGNDREITRISKTIDGQGEKWGAVDKNNVEIVPVIYDELTFLLGNNSANIVNIRVKKDGKYGLFDKNGNEIVPCAYDDISFFMSANETVVVGSGGNYGVINSIGSEIVPLIYENVKVYADGFVVCANGLYGFLDKDGNTKIQPTFAALSGVNEGLIKAVNKDNRSVYGFVDYSGNEVFPFIYFNDSLASNDVIFINGLAAVAIDRSSANETVRDYGIIDTSGKEIIPIEYGYRSEFQYASWNQDGFMGQKYWIAEKDGQMGVINTSNEVVIPFIYGNLDWAENGKVLSYRNYLTEGENFGLLDMAGNRVTPPVYSDIGTASEGLIPVKLNGKSGLIDTAGQEVVACLYDYISNFDNEMAVVVLDAKVGIINNAGVEIAPVRYGQTIYEPMDKYVYSYPPYLNFYEYAGEHFARFDDVRLLVSNDSDLVAQENMRATAEYEDIYCKGWLSKPLLLQAADAQSVAVLRGFADMGGDTRYYVFELFPIITNSQADHRSRKELLCANSHTPVTAIICCRTYDYRSRRTRLRWANTA